MLAELANFFFKMHLEECNYHLNRALNSLRPKTCRSLMRALISAVVALCSRTFFVVTGLS